MLALTMLPPAIPMIALGAAFVIVPAALWPSVALIVEKNRVGTAYGLLTMIQNIGLMVFPWLNGQLRVVTQTYTASMWMFATLGVIGLGLALALRRADHREAGLLEATQ
jgi:MFS-type transporter involved in bile tolerance (Atg22 family)